MKFFALALALTLYIQPVMAADLSKNNYGQYNKSEYSGKVVIVNFNSSIGRRRLELSSYKEDFFQLSPYFESQEKLTNCGIATSVMILNSLRQERHLTPSDDANILQVPKVLGGGEMVPYRYTQNNFFNNETNKIKDKKIIELKNIDLAEEKDKNKIDPGLTAHQFKNILEKVYKLHVEFISATEDIKEGSRNFRIVLKKYLTEDKHFIVINFKGSSIGRQTTSGHISPVVAYNAWSDSVLVLDTASFYNPWYWVKVEDLYYSMHTKDGENYRGYFIISDTI